MAGGDAGATFLRGSAAISICCAILSRVLTHTLRYCAARRCLREVVDGRGRPSLHRLFVGRACARSFLLLALFVAGGDAGATFATYRGPVAVGQA
jgi:hypothetical protein